MAKQVFVLKAVDNMWRGPYQSPYGFHLVMVTAQVAGRTPKLEEIRDRVFEDARQATIRKQTDKAIQGIIKRYKIQLVYRNTPQKSHKAQLKPGTTNLRSQAKREAGVTPVSAQPAKPIGAIQP